MGWGAGELGRWAPGEIIACPPYLIPFSSFSSVHHLVRKKAHSAVTDNEIIEEHELHPMPENIRLVAEVKPYMTLSIVACPNSSIQPLKNKLLDSFVTLVTETEPNRGRRRCCIASTYFLTFFVAN